MSKRMFYPKMPTLFVRGDDFKVIPGEFSDPAFACIDPWIVTEKIDGMNVSIQFLRDRIGDMFAQYRGRTENTNWSDPQADFLEALARRLIKPVKEIMIEHDLTQYELFGELFGPGIQKGGVYGPDIQFRLFDVRVDGTIWLDHQNVVLTAIQLDLNEVPYVGTLLRDDIAYLVQHEMTSLINTTVIAEGIVARPPVRLFNDRGQRVMFKLKSKDF